MLRALIHRLHLPRQYTSRLARRSAGGNVYLILKNRFYVGTFEWGGQTYQGTRPRFLDPVLFEEVQAVLAGHNRPKYSKREIAFRGLMNCAYDGCICFNLWR
jgi:hypothetical protein